MEQYLYRLLFFSAGLLLATAAGIIRYPHVGTRYKPFIIYLCVGVLNEIIGFFCGLWYKTNVINNNIFMLAELLLLNWQFKQWNLYSARRKWYNIAALFFCGFFFANVFWIGINKDLFYFNVVVCFYLVICATERMAQDVAFSPGKLYKDANFILCCAMVIYFSSRVMVDAFWFYGVLKSALFRKEVFLLLKCINLFVNLLYLYALLWIPKKPGYITFYGQRAF